MKLLLYIPPHLKCAATLPREMSDDAFKPATPLTSCVILSCGPKTTQT